MSQDVERCANCSLPTNFPGINFNSDGICSLCQNFNKEEYYLALTKAQSQLNKTIEDVKEVRKRGLSAYDVVVALSGGKDSCFTLKLLAEHHGLRCLAITVDNGFLSKQSILNSNLLCDELGIDFLLWKPKRSFMNAMYVDSLDTENNNKGAIVRASDLCSGCINLINSVMLKEAVARNIPMIAGGYIAGQVPKGSCVIDLRLETIATFAKVKNDSASQMFSLRHYQLSAHELERFEVGDSILIVNPMLSINYDEAQILEALRGIGWKKSIDTGQHSSNCRINDLGIKAHLKNYGFNPYEQEVAEQVRCGNLNRMEAIKKLTAPLDSERINLVEGIIRQNG